MKTVINFNKNNIPAQLENKNIIEGILDIPNKEDIKHGVLLFNSDNIKGIDVYINDKKINLTNDKNKWKIYEGIQNGKNNFKIIFNNTLTTLYSFFEDC